MTDDNLQLSRRRVLAGAGAIGVASAGAGLGTTAYFSDHEEFTDNSLTAGELELFVKYQFAADQGDYNELYKDGIAKGSYHDEEHDPAECSYELDDVKPGDNGSLEFCFSIVDNPAYLWACGMLTDEEAGRSGGHLADHLTATLRYCEKDDEGERTEDGDVIVEGSFRDVLLALRNGVPLDADGDGAVAIEDRACFDGSETKEAFQDTCLCLDWEFPVRSTDPDAELDNNDAQAASMAFDLEFYAEQCRHNDGLTNPCVTSREGEDFAKFEDELAETVWHARGIYGDGGGAANRELDIRDPDDDVLDEGNFAWPNGDYVPFRLTVEDGGAKWDVGGEELGVEDAPVAVADGIGVTVKASAADASIDVRDVRLNGSIPTGPDAVSTDDETVHILLEGATLQEGDEVTGEVAMTWDDAPSAEGIGFRVDV